MPLLLTNDFPPEHGGIQRYMGALAEALAAQGRVVAVVAPKVPGDEAYDRGRTFPIRRYRRHPRAVGLLGLAASLAALGRRPRRDYTIASIWFPTGLVAAFAPRALRGPLGIIAHGTEIAPSRGGLRGTLMRAVFARADAVFANSNFTAALLRRANVRSNVTVVPCGTDSFEIDSAPAPYPLILSAGRLVERKGFDKVIEALPALISQFPDLVYEIVGDGPQRPVLERLASESGVSDRVRFLGALSDSELKNAFARAWCFALPVRAIGDDVEGFGIVYLEAAIAGLATIGGENSGAADAIVHGDTGLVIDGTDSGAVAGALRTLLGDRDRSREMGRRGRERALTHFTWARTAREIHDRMSEFSR